jgi:hypothetical protein
MTAVPSLSELQWGMLHGIDFACPERPSYTDHVGTRVLETLRQLGLVNTNGNRGWYPTDAGKAAIATWHPPAVTEIRDLLTCPRCGERHAELQVHLLTNPSWWMATKAGQGHWAWCPKLQQPIIFVPENIGQSPAA